MNKIIVTGGHGFLGSAVLRELERRGYKNVLSPGSIELNLLNTNAVRAYFYEEEPDTVIHCAGRVGGIQDNIDHPADFMTDNLRMGLNVLQASAARKVQNLVIIGTSCSYPAYSGTERPIQESEMYHGLPTKETGHYGVAKSTIFMAADAFKKQHGLRSALLVPTNLYGPGDKSNHVVNDLIKKFSLTPTGVVQVWGTGRATRDLLFVDDAARGIVLAAENPQPTVPINLGSGVETPISELADRIRRLTGSKAEIYFDSTKPEGQARRLLDITRAKRYLGWEPTTLLEDGLNKTINEK